MTDIKKPDLQTYVKDLIANQFEADKNKAVVPDKGTIGGTKLPNGGRRPPDNHS